MSINWGLKTLMALCRGSSLLAFAALPTAAQVAPSTAGEAPPAGSLVFLPNFFADSLPNTARDMIARLPGFSLDGGDGGARGLSGTAGNVLIDGARPASKTDGLDAVLRRISADSVERIELIRGGASGIDMQGQAIVANVVLKRTVQIQRVIELQSRFYPDGDERPTLKAEYARREGDNQIEGAVSGSTGRTDNLGEGYRRRFDASGVRIQDADRNVDARNHNLDARGAFQSRLAGGRFRINGLVRFENDFERIATLVRSGAGPSSVTDEDEEEIDVEVGGAWTRPLSSRLELDLTGLQRWSEEVGTSSAQQPGRSSTFTNEATAGETIGRAVLRFRRDSRWTFDGGGEASFNYLDSATSYVENGEAVSLPSAAVRVEELRGEVFGQATWRPAPTLTVDGIIRLEVSEISQSGDSELSRAFVYPKPRVQLTWTPAADHQLRLRAEREVGQLNFADFVASAELDLGQVEAGNPDLQPSRSTVVEAGYEWRFWGEGALELTASVSEIEDVVDVIPLPGGVDAVGNIGDGSSGLLEARLTLPMDRLGLADARLQLRGNVSASSVIDPVTGRTRRLSGQNAFGCSIVFNQDLEGGRWAYGFDHGCDTAETAHYRTREISRTREPPNLTVYAQWKPTRDLTVRLEMGNATDRELIRSREVYAGPRDVAPLVLREEQGSKTSPRLLLQIRKTL